MLAHAGAFMRKLCYACHILVVVSLLLQLVLPNNVLPVQAAPLAHSATATPITQATTPADSTTPTAPTPTEIFTQTTPVQVSLQLASLLIHPGETTALTLTVQSMAANHDLTVVFTLPTGLGSAQAPTGTQAWAVPELASGESYTQVLQVQVNPKAFTTTYATLPLTVTVDAPQFTAVTTTALLGIAPATPAETNDVVTAPQTAQGTALENSDGDVTLLVAPDTAPAGMMFVYTELYNATDSITSTGQSTVPLASASAPNKQNAVSGANRSFLPLVSVIGNDAEDSNANLVTATPQVRASAMLTNALPGFEQNGLHIYKMWRFDALQANQRVNQFAGKEVWVAVSIQRLAAQGINPQTLRLWTRPDASQPWTLVHSEYDGEQQILSAWLPHFSEFSLAQGLTNADLLPSVKGFTSDRVTGAATLQYPLATPKGLGGLTPNLSLSYSSITIDDLYQNGGSDGNRDTAQVSIVGAGWNIGGLSRIARAGGSLDNSTLYKDREYVLALNGNFVRIKYENDAWRTDPEIFAKIERPNAGPGSTGADMEQWIITTADGVRYTFGDPNADNNFSSTTATGTFVENERKRLAKEWHLIQVNDTLGNRMDYHYKAEQWFEDGNTGCVVSSDRPDLHWYLSAIYPTEIVWSSHVDAAHSEFNLDPKLRVEFVYSPNERGDWHIDGSDPNDCQQAKFGKQNQLTQLLVEAAVQTGNNTFAWQALRSYTLVQRYGEYRTVANVSNCHNRLLLEGIEERGANGGLLQRHTFTYEHDGQRNDKNNCVVGLNSVRLSTADNGAGGKIHYTYQAHRISCANSVCGDIQKHYRFPVVKMDVEDGVGNTATTTYCYGPTDTDVYGNPYCADNQTTYRCDPSQPEWGAVENSGEYMGFCRSEATYFAANATDYASTSPSIVKWDQMDTWQGERSNPDPRRGKIKRQEMRTRPGGDLLLVTENSWRAYRHAYTDCLNAAGVPNNVGVWCMEPTTSSWHKEKNAADSWDVVYHTLWVRLETTNEWTAGVGKLTKQLYQSEHQTEATNNPVYQSQFGNVTEVQEWSHAETFLDYAAWQMRVITQTAQLQQLRTTVTDYFPISDATRHIVNKPARVRVYAGVSAGTISGCQSEIRTIYDDVNGTYNTPPMKGLVVKTDQAITGCSDTAPVPMYSTQWAETRMAYDAYGNQTVLHHVGGGNTTDRSTDEWINTTYDSIYHLFPVQQQQTPTNFIETASYYGVNGPVLSDTKAYWGAMAEHCSINGVCTRQAYDEFGRRLRRWDNVAATTAWWANNVQDVAATVFWNYRDPARDTTFKTTVITEWHAPRCEGNFVRKHYNGLGQLVAEQKPDQVWQIFAPNQGCNNSSNLNEIETVYAYDSLGNQVRVSAPYRTNTDWVQRINTLDWQQVWQNRPNTQTEYDALSRPLMTKLANSGTTVYQYHGREAKTIGKGRAGDPDKLLKWQELDALGQSRYVRTGIWNGTDWAVDGQATLTHDVLGNLTCVYQPFATTNPTTNPNCSYNPALEPAYGVVSLAYDRLGHKTSMFDGDLRGWYYQYDRQGHLYYQAGGTKYTCLYYDAFGRLKGKLFQGSTICSANPDPNTLNVRFTYDEQQSATNASRGQLTSVAVYSATNGSLVQAYLKNLRYNSQGQVASEAVKIQGAGKTYTTTYTYGAYQRPETMIYPDGEVVTTTYNSMGLASTLRSSQVGRLVDGDTNSGATYDEAGRLTAMHFPAGGDLWQRHIYNPWSDTSANGGLLTGVQVGTSGDPTSKLNLAYTYDSFGNVATLNEGGGVSTFRYDAQNRLTNAYARPYTYDNAGRLTNYEETVLSPTDLTPHLMQRPGKIVSTDSTGNLLARDSERSPTQYLAWDADNHLRRVTVNNNPVESYAYDADGQRVKKSGGGTATYYVNPYYELTGPDLPPTGAVAAAADFALEPATSFGSNTSTQQLFLPWVTQNGQAPAEPTPTVDYYNAATGTACSPTQDAQCTAWVITAAPTMTASLPALALPKLQMQTASTNTTQLTITPTMTESQQLWQQPSALLPGDQMAPPSERQADTEIRAAALLTLTNPGFQLPNSTNTSAANWSATIADTNGYPATALWWQNWGTSAGRETPNEGSTPHYAYSLSNLAYGWLESTYILGLQAGQQYDFAVDLQGALDPANAQGSWLLRAAFYNNSLQPVGAPLVAVQGGAANVQRFTAQRVNGRVTVPVGATKVKLQLVSQLNSGWLAFDNVAFNLVGSSVNLAPSPGFEDPATGQTLGWNEVRSSAHPGTGFYRTDLPSPWSERFASKVYLISNLASGWLESADIPITPGQSYSFTVYYRGEVDHAQSDLGYYGYDLCGLTLQYYNSAGQLLEGGGTLNCNTQRVWKRYAVLTIPPSNAATARVWLMGYGVAGWVAFDDVEFKATNSNTNLVTNGNFEGSGGWTKKWVTTGSNAKAYPATGFTSASTGVGAGRNGGSGYAISNLATGYIESAPVAVTPGKKYQIGAWLRGQLNDQAGQGDWRIRAQFYSASNVDLGYQNGCYGYGENSLTWQQVKCYVITPQNAAKLRLQAWLVQHSGWVAVDDLTVDDLTVAGWDGSTKYYVFNGQRVAMRQGSKLFYLHTDHLGSTKLVTDQEGNAVQAPTQYYAYGREQLPNSTQGLPTEYTFTGQRQDNTGLIYMNARYYDPELGQFISPDTLVPDATNVFDYNRYMYARGNPMMYNDPSGHCETAAPDASDHAAYKEWATCWQYATTILAQWDNTPGYWNDRFTSKDVYMKYVASNGSNHADFFQDAFHQYLKSDEYKAWNAQMQASSQQHWVLAPSTPIDAIVIGVGASGRLSFIGGGSGLGGIEFLAHRDGKVALYTYAGAGGTFGEGANVSVYVGMVKNLPNVDAYGNGFVGQTSATVSVGPLGITFGEFHDLLNANGPRASFIGYAPGADLSVDDAITYYSLPWAVYDFHTGAFSSTQIK